MDTNIRSMGAGSAGWHVRLCLGYWSRGALYGASPHAILRATLDGSLAVRDGVGDDVIQAGNEDAS